MARRAVGMPCSSPPDGVITPPSGEPPGPSPSGGHEKHPGLAATRLTFAFQPGKVVNGYGVGGVTDAIPLPRPDPGYLAASNISGLRLVFRELKALVHKSQHPQLRPKIDHR